MSRFAKISAASMLGVILAVNHVGAFALIGPDPAYPGNPGDAWQVPTIGYNPYPGYDGLQIGPKNIGEEYRRNMPVLFYSFDRNFLDYFGSNGVAAIDQAVAMYNGLTNFSDYSADLSEFPFEAQRVNYQAQALNLLDLRSQVLSLLTEQLGITEPVRYVWTLHDRATIPNSPPCPDGMVYTVVKRNLDPVPSGPNQLQYSSYVNGTLYSYQIFEFCTGPDPLAEAVEFPVDPLANVYTAVAEHALDLGGFYQSFTRDDIGGFRWLMATNRINLESPGSNTVEFVTNLNQQIITGSNLTLFAAQALTNNAATLQALYPGLVVTSSSNFFTIAPVTNFTVVTFTLPWMPAGAFTFRVVTNITYVPVTLFVHTFANLVTIQSFNGQLVSVPMTDLTPFVQHHVFFYQTATVALTNAPWSPPTLGTIVTNFSSRPFVTNTPVGEFFILPTNLCDLAIVDTLLTNVVAQTNILFSFTNTGTIATNVNGGTNFAISQILSQQIYTLDFFTNHTFRVLGVTCPTSPPALYQGIEHVQFVRRDFDSLLGQFFSPITNTWLLTELTNNSFHTRTMQRVVTRPDILFSAADLAPGPAVYPPLGFADFRNINFDLSTVGVGLDGPGSIQPDGPQGPTTIGFSKVGPLFLNYRLDPVRFLDELTAFSTFVWGSFDATTNLPVVYPNGTSIQNLINQTLLPLNPPFAPAGRVGLPYSIQLTTTGGQPPYTWSLASGSLPPGLDLSSDGTISGTPTRIGVYNFTLHLDDGAGHAVDYPYSITITP